MLRNVRFAFLLTALLYAALPVCAQSPLKLTGAVAAQFEDGPPLGNLRLVPGEIVHFSFFAENFQKSETGRVELTGHVSVFDPQGTLISPAEEIPFIATIGEEDKNWRPKLRAEVGLPPLALPGVYQIRYDATDQRSHQTASGETTFEVEAKFVAPSQQLTVRELNFYRNQEDQTALITPSFRAGDMIWVKFYIVGYKYGEMNSIDASYDVDVLMSDGKTLLHQEDAAMEKSTSYYPQPYIPAVFNMTLKPTMAHAVFTLVITAHDATGKQTATAQAQFQVN